MKGEYGDLPSQEEQREYVTCDFPDCKARRLTIDGRSVNQPAIAEAPASWTTHTWFEVDGKDYCPEHGEAMWRTRALIEPDAPEDLDLAPDGILAGDACVEVSGGELPDLDSVLDEAERIAGLTADNSRAGAQYRPIEPSPARSSRDPGSTVSGWIVVALSLVIIGVSWGAFMLWMELDMAQLRLAVDTKGTFETDGHIRELDCDRRGNVFRCSGEVTDQDQTQAPRPVRYTCDKDSCHFECEK